MVSASIADHCTCYDPSVPAECTLDCAGNVYVKRVAGMSADSARDEGVSLPEASHATVAPSGGNLVEEDLLLIQPEGLLGTTGVVAKCATTGRDLWVPQISGYVTYYSALTVAPCNDATLLSVYSE